MYISSVGHLCMGYEENLPISRNEYIFMQRIV